MTEMPWRGIAERAAVAGGAVFLFVGGLLIAACRSEIRREQEATRVRWTDKNRWE